MIKKGKLVLEQKVTVDGDDYLKCTLKSFDSNDYYMNIFKKNCYQPDSVLYESALALNGKYVTVEYVALNNFTMSEPISVTETEDIGLNINIDAYKDDLRIQMKHIKTKAYKELLKELFSRNDVSTKFSEAPASERGAYSYKGGLLHKTVNLLNMIDSLSEYLLDNIDFNIEFLKILAITNSVGKINAYEFVDNVIERTTLGKHFSDRELSAQILMEELSKHRDISPEEKNIILHTALKEDTLRGKSDSAKIKETMVITSFNYLDDMVSSFVILKQNKLNDEQFMRFNNQELYTGNL